MAVQDVKVFDFTDDDDEVGDPIEFKIKYQRKERKKKPGAAKDAPAELTGKWVTMTETFHAVPTVPAGLTMTTVAAFADRGSVASKAVLEYLQRTIMPGDDFTRFQTLIDDDEVKLKMQSLADIVDWLMETYGENPTQSA